ncbi:MAG: hypothetical protein IKT47_04540, partial [Oscillospiraceae bacterium]|nr:hypothetical protein [Oscillospiraceae bacterium]
MKKRILSIVLVLAMVISMVPVAMASETPAKTIKYVSIGDSMTNGYGFNGYNQDTHTVPTGHIPLTEYNFFDGTNVYGDGSYALQFEEYLARLLGKEVDYRGNGSTGLSDGVDHIELALSGFRPEDLLILLGVADAYDREALPMKDGFFNNIWGYAFNDCDSGSRGDASDHFLLYGPSSCGATGWVTYYLYNTKYTTKNSYKWLYPSNWYQGVIASFPAQLQGLQDYYQNNLKDADIISLALGNASFDAYFMDRLFMIWEAMGASDFNDTLEEGTYYGDGSKGPNYDYKTVYGDKYGYEITIKDIKDQLCKSDAEKAFVDKIYEVMQIIAADALGKDASKAMQMDRVCQLLTYITFSYMYSYKQIISWIGENNPDAKIMIVGLTNSREDIVITDGSEVLMDMGENIGALYELLNTYVAGIAADYMAKNKDKEENPFTGKFYYVEQPENPEMIAKVMDKLASANWGKIDCGNPDCAACQNGEHCENGRLSGDIVRFKTVSAYNTFFMNGMISAGVPVAAAVEALIPHIEQAIANPAAFSLTPETLTLANMTAAINASGIISVTEQQVLGTLMFMGAEKAMIRSLASTELDLNALVSFGTGSVEDVLKKVPVPENTAIAADLIDVYENFFVTGDMLNLVRFFALNKVGNGLAAHPTPSNHDRLVANMIAAYQGDYTVQKKCDDDSDMIMVNEIYYALAQKGLLDSNPNDEIIDDKTGTIMDYIVAAMVGEEGMDTTAAGDFIYELLLSNEDDADNVDVIATVYPILKAYGYMDGNDEIALVEELYAVLDEYLDETQEMAVVDYIYANQADLDTMALLDFMVEVLGESNMTAAQKVEVICEVYTILEKNGYLADYSEKLAVVVEIVELPSMKTVTDAQAVAIAKNVYNALVSDGGLDDAEVMAVAKNAYEVLFGNESALKPAEKVAIIKEVYEVLKAYHYLDEYADILSALEKIVALPELKDVPADKTIAIVEAVYAAAVDGNVDNKEFLALAQLIYKEIFAPKAEVVRTNSVEPFALSATEKLTLIMAVVDVLKETEYLDESDPTLVAAENLVTEFIADPEIPNEYIFDIFEEAFTAMVENAEEDGTVGEAAITEVAVKVGEKIVDAPISIEKKLEILEKVTGALESVPGMGDAAVVPGISSIDLTPVKTILAALKANKHITDEKANAVISVLFNALTSGETMNNAKLVDIATEVYNIIGADLTVAEKLEVAAIIYVVAYNNDLIPGAEGYVATADQYLNTATTALAIAKNTVNGIAVPAQLANTKALLVAEIDNTIATVAKLQKLLAANSDWTEILGYQDEIDTHYQTIIALGTEMGVLGQLAMTDFTNAYQYVDTLITTIATDAYNAAIAADGQFKGEYDAVVAGIVAEVEAINPALAAVVEKFLAETPVEAMEIIFAAGDELAAEFIIAAGKASKDLQVLGSAITGILSADIDAIVAAIDANAKITALKAEIAELKADILSMEMSIQLMSTGTGMTLDQLKAK